MTALTGRPIIQKARPYRGRTLLSVAHEMPCMATFAHECNERDGCHPAHANWQAWHKGVGMKASDWAFASVCGNAHRIIDGKVGSDTMPRHLREHYWLDAFIATHDWLWKNKRICVSTGGKPA